MAQDPIKYRTSDAVQLNRQVGPPIDTGYAVDLPDVSANDRDNWTVQLIKPNNKYLNLWVEDASIDFSISGRTGQSRWKREFYPHSFNQPVLKLSGYMPNQREYNKLAAFVRESHAEALNLNRNYINVSEKSSANKPFPTVTLRMRPFSDQKANPRNQKGKRKGMQLEGYIKSIRAGAVKFEFAPAFEIEYVIAQSDGNVGIYGDNLIAGSQIVDWMTLFNDEQFGAKSGTQMRSAINAADQKAEQDKIVASVNEGIKALQDISNSLSNIFDLSS